MCFFINRINETMLIIDSPTILAIIVLNFHFRLQRYYFFFNRANKLANFFYFFAFFAALR